MNTKVSGITAVYNIKLPMLLYSTMHFLRVKGRGFRRETIKDWYSLTNYGPSTYSSHCPLRQMHSAFFPTLFHESEKNDLKRSQLYSGSYRNSTPYSEWSGEIMKNIISYQISYLNNLEIILSRYFFLNVHSGKKIFHNCSYTHFWVFSPQLFFFPCCFLV